MPPTLTPAQFAAKWRGGTATEKAAAQEHFIDLCRQVGEPTPHEADPTGASYAFERRVEKAGGGDGFADVWKRDAAVDAAYGFPSGLGQEAYLVRRLELNTRAGGR